MPHDHRAHVTAAVEQIVARHLTAFKAEAVAAIEAVPFGDYFRERATEAVRNLNTT